MTTNTDTTTTTHVVDRIAQARVALLRDDNAASPYSVLDPMYARRDKLQAELEAWGLSPVQTVELHLIEEELAEYEDEMDAEQQAEINAENGWLRAAEYDPRMLDPREW